VHVTSRWIANAQGVAPFVSSHSLSCSVGMQHGGDGVRTLPYIKGKATAVAMPAVIPRYSVCFCDDGLQEHMLIEVLLPGISKSPQVHVAVASGKVNITVPKKYVLQVDIAMGVGTQPDVRLAEAGRLVIKLPVLPCAANADARCTEDASEQPASDCQCSQQDGGLLGMERTQTGSGRRLQQRRRNITRSLQNALSQQTEPLARQQELIDEMDKSLQVCRGGLACAASTSEHGAACIHTEYASSGHFPKEGR
jgi:hypothetical protein